MKNKGKIDRTEKEMNKLYKHITTGNDSDCFQISSEVVEITAEPAEDIELSDGDPLNLLILPPEILIRIFVNLDLRTLFKTISLVCKTFHKILTADGEWKSIFSIKWENSKIRKDLQYITDWRELYLSYDDINTYWSRKDKWELKMKSLHGHFASVDAVHIMPQGNICVSGSRDRLAKVWNITRFIDDEEIEQLDSICTLDGHKGWVWTISSDPSKPHEVITGSWDAKLKVWDLNNGGEIVETYNYHRSAILSMACQDGLIFTGSFDKKVKIFDPRSNNTDDLTYHKKPVLSLLVKDNLLLTGSEDKTIGIFDRRKLSSDVQTISLDSPVLSMNLAIEQGFNYLRASGKQGSLYVYDMTGQRFVLLDYMELWKVNKVTKLCNFQGSLLACSQDGSFRAYSPDRSYTLLDKQHVHEMDITDAHSRKRVLVTGCSDDSIGIWKFSPKTD